MVSEKRANVVVFNNTGVPLRLVTVVHKYSDEHEDHHEWYNVAPGITTPEMMTVQYHTGFLTTGRDWWLVIMATADGRVFYTNPDNFQGLLNKVEGFSKEAAAALAALGQEVPEPIVQIVAAALKPAVDELWKAGILNKGETGGFKQHILRDEDSTDAGAVNRIIISGLEGSDVVTFESPSGTSRTQATHKQT